MGGSTKQTTQSSSEPWKAAQPALTDSLKDAQNIYKSGQGFQPYTGSTVVPFAQQSTQAMNTISGNATGSQGALNSQFNTVARNAANGGLNGTQQGVVNRLTQQATGGFNPNANPGFQSVMDQALNKAGDAVNMNAAAAGRYGSGTHQGVAARTAGDIAGSLTNAEYNNWQNRRDAANTSLFNAGQQQQNNIWQNTGALSDAYGARQAPSQDLMGVGSMYEDLAGRTMNDQLRIWNGKQQAPKSAVEWLNAIGSGSGSLGGSQSGSAQGPKASPFGQVAGGLLGLGSLFGGL